MIFSSLDSFQQQVSNYYHSIPKNWKEEAVKGFALGFTVSTILTLNPAIGLTAGILSATATLIHALITPFFNKFFADHTMSYSVEMLRGSVAIVSAACLGAAFANALIIESIFFNLLIYGIRIIVQNQELCKYNHTNFITMIL